jgi:hypothetical protein
MMDKDYADLLDDEGYLFTHRSIRFLVNTSMVDLAKRTSLTPGDLMNKGFFHPFNMAIRSKK